MAYRIVLKTRGGVVRRSVCIPSLDKFETQRALKILGKEENIHLGDYIVAEEIIR